MDKKTLAILACCKGTKSIKLLTTKVHEETSFLHALKTFNQQHSGILEVRRAPNAKVHDRYIIHDNGMLFLGPSLNNLGMKQGIVVELGIGMRSSVMPSYKDFWDKATPLT